MNTEKDELWTDKELAERWNVKRQSLAAMRCRGDFDDPAARDKFCDDNPPVVKQL